MGSILISGEERGPRRRWVLTAGFRAKQEAPRVRLDAWAIPDHPIWALKEMTAIDVTTSDGLPWWPGDPSAPITAYHVKARGVWYDAPTLREALDAAWAAVRKDGA